MEILLGLENVFITGAGDPTPLLLEAIAALQAEHTTARVFLTACSGTEAARLGALTLHSWAGIDARTRPEDSAAALVPRMKPAAYTRWQRAIVLIIAEATLVSAAFLDQLDQIGRLVRGEPQQPFGGLRSGQRS